MHEGRLACTTICDILRHGACQSVDLVRKRYDSIKCVRIDSTRNVVRLTPIPTGIPYERITDEKDKFTACQQNEAGAIALNAAHYTARKIDDGPRARWA